MGVAVAAVCVTLSGASCGIESMSSEPSASALDGCDRASATTSCFAGARLPPSAMADGAVGQADAGDPSEVDVAPGRTLDIDLGYEVPPVTGAFAQDLELAARFPPADFMVPAPDDLAAAMSELEESRAMALDLDWDGDLDLLIRARFPDAEFGAGTAVILAEGDGHWTPPERFRLNAPPVAWFGLDKCYSAVDVVGDAAVDLVCLEPGVTVVEGELRDGRSGIVWERRHVLLPGLWNEVPVEFRNRSGEIDVGAASYPNAVQVIAMDIDRDGDTDVVVSTLSQGSPALLLQHEADGAWTLRQDLHTGFHFGALPWLYAELGEWGLSFFTEGAQFAAGWNENSVRLYDPESDGFVSLYPDPRPGDDAAANLGPPAAPDAVIATPMGESWLQLVPGEPPLLVTSEQPWAWTLFVRRDRDWVRLTDAIVGLGRPHSSDDVRREVWAQQATSLRGAAWVHDLVAAVSTGPVQGRQDLGRQGAWLSPPPGETSLEVLIRTRDGFDNRGPENFVEHGYKAMQVADVDGDGRPDVVVGGTSIFPEVWYNRLDPVGGILHLVPRGCAHDCIVEVEDVDTGYVHRQQVTNSANPWIMGPPEVFVGVGDAQQVTVRLYRRVDEEPQTATLPAAGTWYMDPGEEPYQL